jgi:hypothetical protein
MALLIADECIAGRIVKGLRTWRLETIDAKQVFKKKIVASFISAV